MNDPAATSGSGLPFPLEPALRLFPEEPGLGDGFPWIQLLALLALLLALWWRSRRLARHRRTPPAVPAPDPEPAAAEATPDPMDGIRARTLESRRFREGCHELAALVRVRGEAVLGWDLTRRTAVEVGALFRGHSVSRALERLADLRFGAVDPTREHFEEGVDLARRALEELAAPGGPP